MPFTHDVVNSLEVLVDLVNSGPDAESLLDSASLQAFITRHDITEVSDVSDADVAATHTVRHGFRAVFMAPDNASAAELINGLASMTRVAPRLVDHDGYGWHVHYFVPGASLADHLAVDGAMALALVVVAGELERLRICAAPDCTHVLIDLSRNRSKQYCDSRTCGNRLHVAAYRERRRAAAV